MNSKLNFLRNFSSAYVETAHIAQNGATTFPIFNNGQVRHIALTGKGMSGGSLLSIGQDAAGYPRIEIFGIIASGNMNYNTATIW